MKKLLITVLIWVAAVSASYAQGTTFRYLHHGSQSVWVDEDIIGQATRAGVEGARDQMAFTRRQVAEGGGPSITHPFIRWNRTEQWYYNHARELYPNNSLVSTMWYTTAWNAYVYTIDGDQEWVQWYRSLPGHEQFTIDD